MDNIINDYLEQIEKYLKPLTASERIDIINEIISNITELQTISGLSADRVVERLGNPKDLAKAYLGESITKNSNFSWSKLGTVIAFYSLESLKGMIILPFTSVLSVGLMICSAIAPIAGLIKFIGYLFGYDVPFVVIQLGPLVLHPLIVFPISIVFGILFYLGGKRLWKVTVDYVHSFNKKKNDLPH